MEQTKSEVAVLVSATGYHYLCLLEGKKRAFGDALRKASKKWDTCAGEALLRAVGGAVTDTVGRRYNYDCGINKDCTERLRHGSIVDIVTLGAHAFRSSRKKLKSWKFVPVRRGMFVVKQPILKEAYRKTSHMKALSVDAGGVLIHGVRLILAIAETHKGLSDFSDVTESAKKAFKSVFSTPLSENELRYVGDGRESFWKKCVFTFKRQQRPTKTL